MSQRLALLALFFASMTPAQYVPAGAVWPHGGGSIPLSGLIASWDFTRLMSTPQTVSGNNGTSYTITNGPTGGGEGNDCTVIDTKGILCATAGSDDFMHAPVLDSDVTGAITVVVVVQLDDLSTQALVTKNVSATQDIPVKFWSLLGGGGLQLTRANTTANLWDGPAISSGNFAMYTVTAPSDIANAPDFFVATTKTAGTLTSGTASGAATGTGADLRLGLAEDSSMATVATYSYVLVYNRQITDPEQASIYAYMKTYMAGVGVTLP